MALLRLVRLALLSIFRQPVVMAALVMVPATLVLVAADGLQRFGDVVGMTPTTASGAHHGTHFLILTALWSSGISAAVVAAVVLTESAATDRRVGRVGGGGRWLTARCLAFAAVIAASATVSSAMAALRGESLGLDVWLCAVGVSLLYVAVAVIGSRLSCDPVVVVGLISGIWILDALTSPTMGEGGGWRVFASPFYAAEQAAMGMGSLLAAAGVTALWGAGLILVAVVLFRLRPAPVATAGQDGFVLSMTPARGDSRTRHRPAVALLALDLWRYRVLGLFVALGPLALMLSSLWLFGGVEVLVPVVTDGRPGLLVTTMPELHATYMGLIAVVSFGGTAGYMIGASTDGPDRRLAQVSGRLGSVRAVRIGSLVVVGVAVSVSALVPVLIVRSPHEVVWFIAAHVGAAFTFTTLGYGAGLVLDRVTGLMVMMLVPFVDVGIAQDYMLGPVLPDWGAFLPARPFAELVVGAGFGEVASPVKTGLWAAVILAGACALVWALRPSATGNR